MSRARPRVAVIGAGLAGVTAAVAASREGADVAVFEQAPTPGGATVESAGWLWRYEDTSAARRYAPDGDPDVQRAVVDRLDRDVAWLHRRGVRLLSTSTGRSFTTGVRIDPQQAVDALLGHLPADALQVESGLLRARRSASGAVRLIVAAGETTRHEEFDAVVFAGGGYARNLTRVAEHAGIAPEAASTWMLRTRRGGDGTSGNAAVTMGARFADAAGECFTKPAPLGVHGITAAQLASWGELFTPGARLILRGGAEIERADHDWSGSAAMWRLARTGAGAWLALPSQVLGLELHSGVVRQLVRDAVRAGADIAPAPRGGVRLAICPGITTTLGGLVVDQLGRLRSARGSGVAPGLCAAGGDVAGTGLGGTASGLAQALVLGRSAGVHAARDRPWD